MKNHSAISDKLIAIIAPRGGADFAMKTVVLLVLIGFLNFTRDHLEHGTGADSLWANTVEASFVGLPFCFIALALIGRLKRMQDELIALAATDMLTGLNNRRAFYEKVAAIPNGAVCVLMIVDVDHFKRVNDTFGHGIGDRCLQQVSAHLSNSIREKDILARIGGEEFAIVLVGADRAIAEQIGARLVEGVKISTATHAAISVTLSIGAVILGKTASFEEEMREADAALYMAKSAGRARMVLSAQP